MKAAALIYGYLNGRPRKIPSHTVGIKCDYYFNLDTRRQRKCQRLAVVIYRDDKLAACAYHRRRYEHVILDNRKIVNLRMVVDNESN